MIEAPSLGDRSIIMKVVEDHREAIQRILARIVEDACDMIEASSRTDRCTLTTMFDDRLHMIE
jgi:hypothetical protein